MLAWLAAGLLFAASPADLAAPSPAAPSPAAPSPRAVAPPASASPQDPGLAPRGGPRASAATRAFVNAPYLASPLGEGEGPDPDPRLRLDAFDCMTLVETAVALGSAASPEEAAVALDDVRYSGPPALARRNHEVLSQWIPANVAKGWIAPLTRALAGDATFAAAKTYTPESWEAVRRAGRAIRGLPRSRLPLGRFALDAVPVAAVPALARRIPDGTIVLAVRADAPDRATRVTHAALVVRGPRGEALVRHATSSKGVGRVIEEPLERFLLREARAYPRWPLEAVSFFEIRDNAARLRALMSPSVHRAGGGASGRSPPPPPTPL